MRAYSPNRNVQVIASKPLLADAAFLKEAAKCGIKLHKDAIYPYFGDKNGNTIASTSQYLVLFGENEYLAVSDKIFNSLFLPVESA